MRTGHTSGWDVLESVVTPVMSKPRKGSTPLPTATQKTVDINESEAHPPQKDKVGTTKAGLQPATWPPGAGAEAALDACPRKMAGPGKSLRFLTSGGGQESWGSISTRGIHSTEQPWISEDTPQLTHFPVDTTGI